MYTKKPFLNCFFENVTFRVTTEFPTHSIQRHCCQLLVKNLQEIQNFYQTHGAEENVFNSIGNLEKVSLALSLQAKNSHQSRLTDYFTPK